MSDVFDFMYNMNNHLFSEEDVTSMGEAPVKKVKKAIDIIPKKVKKNSYGHIALNIFKSLYPDKFPSATAAANKFEQLRLRIRGRVIQYEDLSTRLNIQKYAPEVYEQYKKLAQEKGIPLLLKRPLFSDELVDKLLADGYSSVLLSIIPAKQIQEMIMDPDNAVGQALLFKIDPSAKLLGKGGYELTGWDDPEFVGIKVEDESGKVTPLIPGETKAEEPVKTETPQEKEVQRLITPAKKIEADKPRRIEDLKGSSLVNNENRKLISLFIKNMVNYVFLERDADGNKISAMSAEEKAKTRRMYDELMYDAKNDVTPIESIFKSIIKIITEGIAYKLATIAVRGLVEYEIYYFDKPESSPLMKKAYLDRIFNLFEKQISLTGLSFYPNTISKFKNQWIKFADESLTMTGFDDDLEELLTYSRGVLDRKVEEGTLPHMKEAIESTQQSIRSTLDKDPQYLQGMSDVLLDKQLIRTIFKDVDVDLKDKIENIEKKEKGGVIDTAYEKRLEKINTLRAKDFEKKREEEDVRGDTQMGLSPEQIEMRKQLRNKLRAKAAGLSFKEYVEVA
jgi:hypothetical protein